VSIYDTGSNSKWSKSFLKDELSLETLIQILGEENPSQGANTRWPEMVKTTLIHLLA
jgi:hypothetical protein